MAKSFMSQSFLNKEFKLKVNSSPPPSLELSCTKLLLKSISLTQLVTLIIRNPSEIAPQMVKNFLRGIGNLRVNFQNFIKKNLHHHPPNLRQPKRRSIESCKKNDFFQQLDFTPADIGRPQNLLQNLKASNMISIINHLTQNKAFKQPSVEKSIREKPIMVKPSFDKTRVKKLSVVEKPGNEKPIVVQKPSTVIEKPSFVEKSSVFEKPNVVEKSSVFEKPRVVEKPSIFEKPNVVEKLEKPSVVEKPNVLKKPSSEKPSIEKISVGRFSHENSKVEKSNMKILSTEESCIKSSGRSLIEKLSVEKENIVEKPTLFKFRAENMNVDRSTEEMTSVDHSKVGKPILEKVIREKPGHEILSIEKHSLDIRCLEKPRQEKCSVENQKANQQKPNEKPTLEKLSIENSKETQHAHGLEKFKMQNHEKTYVEKGRF